MSKMRRGTPPGVPMPPACFVPRFDELRTMTCAQLAQLGCRRWDESGLMLFPHAWFEHVPSGYVVRDIFGRSVAFDARLFSSDQRYGVLSFGVVGVDAQRGHE